MKVVPFLAAFALAWMPQKAFSQILHPYIQSSLANPEAVSMLREIENQLSTDAAFRQAANQQIEAVCERSKISLYRGGGGWNQDLQEKLLAFAYTKQWLNFASSYWYYQALSKTCYKYQ